MYIYQCIVRVYNAKDCVFINVSVCALVAVMFLKWTSCIMILNGAHQNKCLCHNAFVCDVQFYLAEMGKGGNNYNMDFCTALLLVG